METKNATEVAVFGGGCFWCTEAVFKMMKGVMSVLPGYAGGTKPDPTYDEVCSGTTGHAEVIRIEYDPTKVRYEDLLTVFFATHDPTTLNRQGNDIGTQYRSLVLTTTDAQRQAAETYIKELEASSPGGTPIVTEIKPLDRFYEAEDEHKDYFAKNPDKPYCSFVITPKVKKAKEKFAALLKSGS
jgi:peptide-methionine (S)-S-oxide reductase